MATLQKVKTTFYALPLPTKGKQPKWKKVPKGTQGAQSVTVESTRAAGAALMARARPAIAALGPGKGLEGAATIVESLKRQAA